MVEAILEAGHIPAGMELFSGAGTVIRTIQKWIDESDIYFLLLGGRYGSIYNKEGISFTEWEYNLHCLLTNPYALLRLMKVCCLRKRQRMERIKFLKKNIWSFIMHFGRK